MLVKEALRQLFDTLSGAKAADLLEYVHWLRDDRETLTPEELARVRQGAAQLRRGEYVTLDALKRDLAR